MTPAEYAAHRECDVRTVRRGIDDGEIATLRDGRVDVVAADAAWTPRVRRPRSAIPAESPEAPKSDPKPETLRGSRERLEAARAGKAELELAQKKGELVDLAEIRVAVLAFAARVRRAIEDDSGSAQAVADVCVCTRCGGPVAVRDVSIALEDHRRRVLEQLADNPVGG